MNSSSSSSQFSLDSNRVVRHAVGSALLVAVLLFIWAGTTTAHAQGEKPAKPMELPVTTESGLLEVSVDWDDVAGATDYLVRWRVAGPGNPLNDGMRASSSDTRITVADYGDWVVRVEACNDSGCGLGQTRRFQVIPASEPASTPTPEPARPRGAGRSGQPGPTPEPTPTPTPTVTITDILIDSDQELSGRNIWKDSGVDLETGAHYIIDLRTNEFGEHDLGRCFSFAADDFFSDLSAVTLGGAGRGGPTRLPP